jgi:hypothetical protein
VSSALPARTRIRVRRWPRRQTLSIPPLFTPSLRPTALYSLSCLMREWTSLASRCGRNTNQIQPLPIRVEFTRAQKSISTALLGLRSVP